MSEYVRTYQEWQALKVQLKKARDWKDVESFQKLKAEERKILAKLNTLL